MADTQQPYVRPQTRPQPAVRPANPMRQQQVPVPQPLPTTVEEELGEEEIPFGGPVQEETVDRDSGFTFRDEDAPSRVTALTATMEDITGFGVDRAKHEEDKKKLYLPAGEYYLMSGREWTVTVTFRADDIQSQDKSPQGRLIIRLSGLVQDDKGHSGIFSFGMSPDARYGMDYDTKQINENQWDTLYKTWFQATDYYERIYQAPPQEVRDVVEHLVNDRELRLRVTQGRDGRNYLGNFVYIR